MNESEPTHAQGTTAEQAAQSGVSGQSGQGSGQGSGQPVSLPTWMHPIVAAAATAQPEHVSRSLPPDPSGGRQSAVLILFGESPHAESGHPVPDLLIIERAHDMRSHAGQPAFPGGAMDPGDDGLVAAALREGAEETGLDPAGVTVVAIMPAIWLPPSNFVVTPVVGYWHRPVPVRAGDPVEVASVHRIPLSELVDPNNRLQVKHPSGFVGPAFAVRGLTIWGFTGGLLARLLTLSGLDRPWDRDRVQDLPEHQLEQALRSSAHPGVVAGTTGGDE